MRRIYTDTFLFALCLLLGQVQAQKPYPKDYFRAPVEFRMLLSGTFGEIRTNHFHSGMDIKTNGAEGAKVFAVADGYVSRINVSAVGFGKALYITHPNGYTSVYAHLNYFAGPIHEYVMKEHYSRESFEMVVYPQPGELGVMKGEIVAYSGNSGTSGGPHLHFELRDDASQDPINPLLFGLQVKDLVPPRMTWLKIYALDEASRINGAGKDVKYQVEGSGKEHRLSASGVITLSGKIAFGIQCHDQQNDTDNKNGIYTVSMYLDQQLISSYRMESFSFADTRYVNSLVDYDEFMRTGMRFQRTEIDPGNRLTIYGDHGTKGSVIINDEAMHEVIYDVSDAAGNSSVLKFSVKGQKAPEIKTASTWDEANPSVFIFDRANSFAAEDFNLEAPAGSFYRTFIFTYSKSPAVTKCLSEVHRVHNRFTPIHAGITIGIKPDLLPEKLRGKALVVKVDESTSVRSSAGGEWEEDGFVRTTVREFGNYAIAVDTIPPSIVAIDPSFHKNLAGRKTLRFTVKDELSGIKSYRGTLNGQWVLMDYDAKNDLLVYFIEGHMKKGMNTFRLIVTDMKGNSRTYEAEMVL